MYCAAMTGTVIVLLILGAVYYLIPQNPFTGWINTGLLILAVITVLNMLISPYFRYHRYQYAIDEEYIDIVEGYVFVERNIVPMERLHKVKTERGPIDRLFRVEKVIVSTAGGDVRLRFLDVEKADWIADTLKKRINEIAAAQRNSSLEA